LKEFKKFEEFKNGSHEPESRSQEDFWSGNSYGDADPPRFRKAISTQ